MKKTKRIMLRIIPVLIVAFIMLTKSVLATNELSGFGNFNENMVVEKPNDTGIASGYFYRIIDFIIGISPIASIFTIVFCWIIYIVSSKEKKVKLRKIIPFIVILAAFVFVYSQTVIFLTSAYDE